MNGKHSWNLIRFCNRFSNFAINYLAIEYIIIRKKEITTMWSADISNVRLTEESILIRGMQYFPSFQLQNFRWMWEKSYSSDDPLQHPSFSEPLKTVSVVLLQNPAKTNFPQIGKFFLKINTKLWNDERFKFVYFYTNSNWFDNENKKLTCWRTIISGINEPCTGSISGCMEFFRIFWINTPHCTFTFFNFGCRRNTITLQQQFIKIQLDQKEGIFLLTQIHSRKKKFDCAKFVL